MMYLWLIEFSQPEESFPDQLGCSLFKLFLYRTGEELWRMNMITKMDTMQA